MNETSSPERLPALPVSVTDPTTAQMCAETGHVCPACSTEVRNLGAVAHNALNAIRTSLETDQDWARARRKIAELERVIGTWTEGTLAAHFEALKSWRRP